MRSLILTIQQMLTIIPSDGPSVALKEELKGIVASCLEAPEEAVLENRRAVDSILKEHIVYQNDGMPWDNLDVWEKRVLDLWVDCPISPII